MTLLPVQFISSLSRCPINVGQILNLCTGSADFTSVAFLDFSHLHNQLVALAMCSNIGLWVSMCSSVRWSAYETSQELRMLPSVSRNCQEFRFSIVRIVIKMSEMSHIPIIVFVAVIVFLSRLSLVPKVNIVKWSKNVKIVTQKSRQDW